MYIKIIKRCLDFILSLLGLIVLSPIFVILSIVIKLDSKGPILFKQKRFGRNKSFFYIYKFRTMYVNTPENSPTHLLLSSENYITRNGKFLRKTSLDEIPQLFNILKGEMSFIGPRPALWNQTDLIEERDRYCANNILPGLTGYAQISGRDELTITEKAKYDGLYMERISFQFDCFCFFQTFFSVLKREGVVEGIKEVKPKDGYS